MVHGTTRPDCPQWASHGTTYQDPGCHFGSAMPHPSSSDAMGVPMLSPVSVLPLARLGPQLVAPQKCHGLLVALLSAPAHP